MQYMFTGMFMAVIGGFIAYVFRMQLAFPGIEVPGYGPVSPGEYNALITNHGSIMIFWVAMPVLIAAFGNYLIPLMIGADDMVFPKHQPALVPDLPAQRARAARVVLRGGGAFGGAWTAYPPLSAKGRVQPDAAGLVALAGRGGARVRRLPAGRHQLRHDRDELARARA
jgi:cytochrome c oxidase subunit I